MRLAADAIQGDQFASSWAKSLNGMFRV